MRIQDALTQQRMAEDMQRTVKLFMNKSINKSIVLLEYKVERIEDRHERALAKRDLLI